MNRFAALALAVLTSSLWTYAQDTPSISSDPANPAPLHLIGHGAFAVRIICTLDSSKLKEGDVIEVEILSAFKLRDGRLVPKKSRVTGYITKSTARSKGATESELSTTFAKIDLGDKPLQVRGIVQAVFPPPDEEDPSVFGIPPSGGITGMQNDIKTGSNLDSEKRGRLVMTTESVGVEGMHNLELGQDGSLKSKGKSVKLGVNVRMIVRAAFLE
jgi:hypothetical protein